MPLASDFAPLLFVVGVENFSLGAIFTGRPGRGFGTSVDSIIQELVSASAGAAPTPTKTAGNANMA
jgi:hypothetical protein